MELFKKLPKQYYLPLILALTGLIFFAYGLIQYFSSQSSHENNSQPQDFTNSPPVEPSARVNSVSVSQAGQIKIDVEGEVENPGVYSISIDSRVQDAIVKAGGLSANADRNWVKQKLNLAAKITDGSKIYIPNATDQNVLGANNSPVQDVIDGSSVININTASVDSLDSLPGVGVVTAQKIISLRPYSNINDLLNKKAVNKLTFNKIKDKVGI